MATATIIKAIIAYIISHPTLAQALRDALFSGGDSTGAANHIYPQHQHEATPEWVSASAAGKMIGKSGTWMKAHRLIFPNTRYEKRGEKGKWWFDRTEIQGCYDVFVRQQSATALAY